MNDNLRRMELVDDPQPGTVAHIRANKLPAMTGQEDQSLACGNCGMGVFSGVSPERIHKRFETEQPLVMECICGAMNLVPRDE